MLASIQGQVLQCIVAEESTGAEIDLHRESRAFAPMEIVTNLCMAEHVRHDVVELANKKPCGRLGPRGPDNREVQG